LNGTKLVENEIICESLLTAKIQLRKFDFIMILVYEPIQNF